MGNPASSGGDIAQAITELEQDLTVILTKYNNRLPPAAAVGVLQWMAMNIFQIASMNAAVQNAAMMERVKQNAGKLPIQ